MPASSAYHVEGPRSKPLHYHHGPEPLLLLRNVGGNCESGAHGQGCWQDLLASVQTNGGVDTRKPTRVERDDPAASWLVKSKRAGGNQLSV